MQSSTTRDRFQVTKLHLLPDSAESAHISVPHPFTENNQTAIRLTLSAESRQQDSYPLPRDPAGHAQAHLRLKNEHATYSWFKWRISLPYHKPVFPHSPNITRNPTRKCTVLKAPMRRQQRQSRWKVVRWCGEWGLRGRIAPESWWGRDAAQGSWSSSPALHPPGIQASTPPAGTLPET